MFNSHYINIVENMTEIPPDISPLYHLQELEVDSKLNFDEHLSKLCNKSAGQLTMLSLAE